MMLRMIQTLISSAFRFFQGLVTRLLWPATLSLPADMIQPQLIVEVLEEPRAPTELQNPMVSFTELPADVLETLVRHLLVGRVSCDAALWSIPVVDANGKWRRQRRLQRLMQTHLRRLRIHGTRRRKYAIETALLPALRISLISRKTRHALTVLMSNLLESQHLSRAPAMLIQRFWRHHHLRWVQRLLDEIDAKLEASDVEPVCQRCGATDLWQGVECSRCGEINPAPPLMLYSYRAGSPCSIEHRFFYGRFLGQKNGAYPLRPNPCGCAAYTNGDLRDYNTKWVLQKQVDSSTFSCGQNKQQQLIAQKS